MNCRDFNDRLYDYLDDTLDSDVHARIDEHLRECADCRRALGREKGLAESIKASLEHATVNLSLRPETLPNLLVERTPSPSPAGVFIRAWQWLIACPVRPASAGAVLLAALVLFIGLEARHQPAENSGSQAAIMAEENACVIDVPIQNEVHVFRRQNGTVTDVVTPGVAAGYARFVEPENSAKPL